MIKRLLLLSVLCSLFSVQAQPTITASAFGWKEFTIQHPTLGEIHYGITSQGIDEKKPVLLYLDGSGSFPLFQLMKEGSGSSVPFDYRKLAEKYHLVVICKPGVPFADSVGFNEEYHFPIYNEPVEYTKRLSAEWRIDAADTVLNHVLATQKTDGKKVAVLGISEGAQVAAHVAAKNKNTTHLLFVVGNGLNQFFDFIIKNRNRAARGEISQEVAQKNIDSLYTFYKQLTAKSTSTQDRWSGHTYLRWASFCNIMPVESITRINIPVYVVASSNDENTSVLSSDYIYLENIRKGKTNMTYKVYPYDHMFNEAITDEKGKVVGMKSHIDEVMDAAFEWLGK